MDRAANTQPSRNLPLYRRAQAQVPELARRMVAAIAAEEPFYGRLPREMLEGEVTDITVANLRTFYAALRENRAPNAEELAEQAASAARRAQELFPLDSILAVHHISARAAWEALMEMARPDETAELLDTGTRILRYLEALCSTVAVAYLKERQAIHGEEREAQRALVSALLAGEPAADLAERADVTLATTYVVVVLQLPLTARAAAGEESSVAGRRTVRHIQTELDAYAHTQVLGALDGTGGTVLVPSPPHELDRVLAGLPDVADRIGKATGHPVTVGMTVAVGLEAIPAAAQEASEIAMLVRRLGRPSGAYRLDDVLLEYQLSRPGPARDRLAARLDRLEGNPHLFEALRAFVAHGYNRSQAAVELHVHRNTLDYRLRRVATLTELDPADPTDARILAAAVTTRDLLTD